MTAALILWWLTDDIIVALVCLFSLIMISFIARLYQPWNEEKVIEELNIQNKKTKKAFFTGPMMHHFLLMTKFFW